MMMSGYPEQEAKNLKLIKTYPAILNEMHGEKSFLLPLAES